MASLFQRKQPAPQPTSPYELIEKEVEHLKKKRGTARQGDKPAQKMSIAILVFLVCALVGLYILDPIEHAWYKYEAIRAYTYLHDFGGGGQADEVAATGILQPQEVALLNRGTLTYKDYFNSPQDAAKTARSIIAYMASVKQLHARAYEDLDPVNKLRYALFIRENLFVPTSWDSLDPAVTGN